MSQRHSVFPTVGVVFLAGALAFAGAPAGEKAKAPIAQAATRPPLRVELAKGTAKVEFFAVGWPSALKIHGKGSGLQGSLTVAGGQVAGRVTFNLQGLDTGIGLRNRHMQERYLETDRYPEARLTLSRLDLASVPAGESFAAHGVPFSGILELHGVARPVTGQASIGRSGEGVTVDADFDVRTGDFEIPTPGYLGITVAEQVKVKVHFSAPVEDANLAAGNR